MPKKPMGAQAKNSTLTFRLPEKLKTLAAAQAARQQFRSTGEYVTALIEGDVLKKKAA